MKLYTLILLTLLIACSDKDNDSSVNSNSDDTTTQTTYTPYVDTTNKDEDTTQYEVYDTVITELPKDTIAPQIFFKNGDTITVIHPNKIDHSNVEFSDNTTDSYILRSSFTVNSEDFNRFDDSVDGVYFIIYQISDNEGNSAEKTQYVKYTVPEPEKRYPTITLYGHKFYKIDDRATTMRDIREYLNITAMDVVDGVLTDSIQFDDSKVQYGTVGAYTLHPYVENSDGNRAQDSIYVAIVKADSTPDPTLRFDLSAIRSTGDDCEILLTMYVAEHDDEYDGPIMRIYLDYDEDYFSNSAPDYNRVELVQWDVYDYATASTLNAKQYFNVNGRDTANIPYKKDAKGNAFIELDLPTSEETGAATYVDRSSDGMTIKLKLHGVHSDDVELTNGWSIRQHDVFDAMDVHADTTFATLGKVNIPPARFIPVFVKDHIDYEILIDGYFP